MRLFFEAFLQKRTELFTLFIDHIQLTLLAVSISVIIGVCLGIFITRNKTLANAVIGVANLIQSIPSLAILGFLIPVVGIGATPAIIMVVLYSMLPIVKNTYTSLMNINPDTIEAAKGIGMTKRQILAQVKIPLAVPVIMAGIRIASVTAVGLMTIAAFVGAGGLGYLVFSGIQTTDNNLILLGAIPAAILALFMDYFVGKIEQGVTPNGIKSADGKLVIRKTTPFYKNKLIIGLVIVIIAGTVGNGIYNANKSDRTIVVGSKNYTEQIILGSMVADLIEAKTDINVETKLNLGGTQVIFEAIKRGDVDVYIDYTGTMLLSVLGEQNTYGTKEQVYDRVKEQYREKFNIETLAPLGYNNTYAMAVTPATKEKYNLETVSDLQKVASEMVISPTLEFANREDGLLGVEKTYGLNFKDVKPVDGSLRYVAIDSAKCDVIDAFTTDGLLEQYQLALLEDDKNFFPPYYAVPLIRQDTLEEYPELKDCLESLSGNITDDIMRKLNYKVDVERQDPEKVARDFLVENGYIK